MARIFEKSGPLEVAEVAELPPAVLAAEDGREPDCPSEAKEEELMS